MRGCAHCFFCSLAFLLALLVTTSDLHALVYIPQIDLSSFVLDKAAAPMFRILDNGYLLLLLWYHTAVTPVDDAENEIHFNNAKEYYDYCRAEADEISEREVSALFENSDDEDSVMYWMYCNSCAADD